VIPIIRIDHSDSGDPVIARSLKNVPVAINNRIALSPKTVAPKRSVLLMPNTVRGYYLLVSKPGSLVPLSYV